MVSVLLLIAVYFFMPFVFLGILLAFKWMMIIIHLIMGNQEAIHSIRNSTCNRPKTWGEWFDYLIDQPRPNDNFRHRDYDGRPPWRSDNWKA